MVNYGKEFERRVYQGFKKDKNTMIYRLQDQMSGYYGSRNPSDFIVYHYPYFMFVECKAYRGNTINFSNITQWDRLKEHSSTYGVGGIVIMWFIDHDITIAMSIQMLDKMKQDGLKSVNIINLIENRIPYKALLVRGKKKRQYFEYDFSNWFRHFDTEFNSFSRSLRWKQ